ncbi:hypothetical protein VTN00DRAFT_6730 [Thermoascus crustaceus]|uniref:uncharacterized protein n=1 Tax=Thermoascus crustaceus TaxID=5088 RepID=UPI00374315DF
MAKQSSTSGFGLDFLSLHPFVRSTVVDKLRGVIFGSALGDAVGLYTDDTDHALLIILSYLHNDRELLPHDLARRLRTWCEQGLKFLGRPPLGVGKTVETVALDPGYLSNPTATALKYWVKGNYNVASNGSLMRTHPLGIICLGKPLNETFRVATDFSIVTHADPRCVVSCCVTTGLIRGVLRGEILGEEDVDKVIEDAFEWVDRWVRKGRRYGEDIIKEDAKGGGMEPQLNRKEFDRYVRVTDFDELQLDETMGYVYKSLGAAILTLRLGMQRRPYLGESSNNSNSTETRDDPARPYHNLFEELITTLIMQGGDADTNSCIAGSLLGAWVGYTALPPHWRDGIQHHNWLLCKCNALAQTIGVVSDQLLLPGYRGSEDQDTRDDGGKGVLSKELEVQEEVFSDICLGPKEQKKKKEDEIKTEETKKEEEKREQKQGGIGRLSER